MFNLRHRRILALEPRLDAVVTRGSRLLTLILVRERWGTAVLVYQP